ncbi:MAG: terminase small subunit, partial [Gammaproteobacteria bacterium]
MNDKRAMFCREYLVDFNATQAAIRAGYSVQTAGAQGGQLLQILEVQVYVAELMDARSKRVDITADDVLR